MTNPRIENIDIQLLLGVFLQAYLALQNYPYPVDMVAGRTIESTYDDYTTNVDTKSPDKVLIIPGNTSFVPIGNEVWEERTTTVSLRVYSGRGESTTSTLEGFIRAFFKDWNEGRLFNNFRCRKEEWDNELNALTPVKEDVAKLAYDQRFLLFVKMRLLDVLKSAISELDILKLRYQEGDTPVTTDDVPFFLVRDFVERVNRILVTSEEVPNNLALQDKVWRVDMDVEISQYVRILQTAQT